jgi:hypothetical protein
MLAASLKTNIYAVCFDVIRIKMKRVMFPVGFEGVSTSHCTKSATRKLGQAHFS